MYWKASATDWIRSSCLMAVMRDSVSVMSLVLKGEGLGHGLVDNRHGQGGEKEDDVNDDLPLQGMLGQVAGIDEALQQVDRRNADDRGRQLDLEHAGIDVRKPFRLVRMSFEVEAGNEGFIAADDDHDQQVGDHDDVDQAKDDQHDFGLGEIAAGECSMD